ncbi:Serine protease-like protein [Sulfitobacter noctilucae]|uniref:trypsin-like serine peptidase n=1 Tax=Sulfitobacter noctilucae TaxID=1342302 RepID=UPI0004688506|nr:trypsin-like peptidase domain-containing protein [Sulfitobacter noctilucae]KIN65505.1 Serine protease-like protein [Sulfitobacter noctilucae]
MKIFNIIAGLSVALCLNAGVAAAQSTKLRSLDTRNDALAWEAVGRLDIARKGHCTGTLIAPDLVLTAAHCVYGKDRKLAEPDSITFQAGLTHGKAAAKRKVAQVEAHVGYVPKGTHDMNNVRHDVALVRLAEPIPTHVLDPFIVHQGNVPDGPVSVVSYGQGRLDQLSRQNQCQVLGQRDRIVAVDCDVTFGSSGAPVFTHQNGRGRIASVISGGGVYGGKSVAFGMALPALVSDLKRQMRANAPRPTAQVRRLSVGGKKGNSGAKFVTAKGS